MLGICKKNCKRPYQVYKSFGHERHNFEESCFRNDLPDNVSKVTFWKPDVSIGKLLTYIEKALTAILRGYFMKTLM